MADNDRRDAGRRKAQDQFNKMTQRDEGFRQDRERAHTADAVKMARLKALRLAKEAADREAAAVVAREKGEEPDSGKRARKRAVKKAPGH